MFQRYGLKVCSKCRCLFEYVIYIYKRVYIRDVIISPPPPVRCETIREGRRGNVFFFFLVESIKVSR